MNVHLCTGTNDSTVSNDVDSSNSQIKSPFDMSAPQIQSLHIYNRLFLFFPLTHLTLKHSVCDLHADTRLFHVRRLYEDTISPKLFTATLESLFRMLNWENESVKIDGEFLNNFHFADDTFVCTGIPQKLQHMLQELSDESWVNGSDDERRL